jgi:signal transduction histidine kinase
MIAMGSLLFVMVLLVGAINAFSVYYTSKRVDTIINSIANNQGKLPEFNKEDHIKGDKVFDFQFNPETKFITRYFWVKVNSDGTINGLDTGHIEAITSEDAQEYAEDVMASGKDKGYYDIYKYSVIEQSDGYMIVFLDCRNELQTAKQILVISGSVSLGVLILMFILISVFSKRAIKPIIESTEKQKLFITDAGHEIKTPLAIISANADVIELMNGENEWLASIRNQVIRLDKLVKNLLTLSKMEEDNLKVSFNEFNLSETVARIAGPFAAVAEAKNKKFIMEIQPGRQLFGDESSMEQLVSTLVDNAMKYSNEEGTIKLSLASHKKGVKLEVFNTTDEIDTDNLDKLFDRFYRADSSRARQTGGYGIGLSIAKSIVEAHHGKISVKSEDGRSICFTAII